MRVSFFLFCLLFPNNICLHVCAPWRHGMGMILGPCCTDFSMLACDHKCWYDMNMSAYLHQPVDNHRLFVFEQLVGCEELPFQQTECTLFQKFELYLLLLSHFLVVLLKFWVYVKQYCLSFLLILTQFCVLLVLWLQLPPYFKCDSVEKRSEPMASCVARRFPFWSFSFNFASAGAKMVLKINVVDIRVSGTSCGVCI